MLVDIALTAQDPCMLISKADGSLVLSIPLYILRRAHAEYLANQTTFDAAEQQSAQSERTVQ